MIEPFCKDSPVALYNGDCVEMMKQITDGETVRRHFAVCRKCEAFYDYGQGRERCGRMNGIVECAYEMHSRLHGIPSTPFERRAVPIAECPFYAEQFIRDIQNEEK